MAVPGTGISSAVAIPYVEIVNCCDTSDRGIYNIEGFDPNTFQEGVYIITGPGFVTGQIIFNPDSCYLITYPGNAGVPYPGISLSEFAQFTLSSTDIENGCAECINCNPDLSKLIFTSCCGQSVIETQGPLPGGFLSGGLINYTGTPANGFENFCYDISVISNITPEEYNTLPLIPLQSQYTVLSYSGKATCEEYKLECPTCEDPQCYTLVNCDGLYFNTWFDLSGYVGQYIEIEEKTGTWFVIEQDGKCDNAIITVTVLDTVEPCPCLCYEITGTLKSLQYVNCDNEVVKDATITKFCSRVYPIFSGTPGQFQIIQGEECVDGLCPAVCYKLTNCDTKEIIYSTLQTLSQYVNTSSVITLLGYEGCWEVEESISSGCDCITVTIEAREQSGLISVTEHTALNIGTYNGWGVWKFTVGTDDFYIWNASTNPSTNWVITIIDCCANPGTTYAESKFQGDCPETISDGNLTGWVIQEVPWINVQTEKCPGPCDCPVDVTVLQEFSSCETCEPYIAYKLQNCEKIYEVQYTTQNLSAYVNQVVETDCGCFTVQQINYVPPSETLVVIDNVFKRCNDCLSTFYRLTDCAGEVGDIVTTTDLSDYVGSVIKIENCDTCWEIETTRTFETLSNVVVAEQFEGCRECGVDLPCVCSKLTNLTLTEQTIEYIDCENNTQEITLLVGETSEKICLKKWILPELPEGQFLYAEYFGNCLQLDTTAFVCPQPVFKNNRTVKPGYNTPICSPEKYDNITCRFAEIMYKLALEKRYGITNCCPEEDDRWLIQKELIDLQALKDPNYKCKECTCGCNNNTSQTCNCKN
jgi:hypothetical protein